MIEYYSIRRISPYLGILQVIDAGAVRAYSTDGRTWQARRVHDSERFWHEPAPADAEGFEDVSREALRAAVHGHPPQPFPMGDRYELWLLRKATGLPLALLRTCRWPRDMDEACEPMWRPFLPGERRFDGHRRRLRRAAGEAVDLCRDQDRLQTVVNYAAKPLATAQWFQRHDDGAGTGLGGLRVPEALVGRRLEPTAFPELLADERWDDPGEAALVRAFHDWSAPWLLAHQNLSRATRVRLERAAHDNPGPLLDTRATLPEVLDREAMDVAVVKARLMRSA